MLGRNRTAPTAHAIVDGPLNHMRRRKLFPDHGRLGGYCCRRCGRRPASGRRGPPSQGRPGSILQSFDPADGDADVEIDRTAEQPIEFAAQIANCPDLVYFCTDFATAASMIMPAS